LPFHRAENSPIRPDERLRSGSVPIRLQHVRPRAEELAQAGDVNIAERQIDIAVAGQIPDHVDERSNVEAGIDLARQPE
jgi:hypothetical protein